MYFKIWFVFIESFGLKKTSKGHRVQPPKKYGMLHESVCVVILFVALSEGIFFFFYSLWHTAVIQLTIGVCS